MSTKLSDKQKRFCEEYVIDLNATQACIRAGYSAKCAKEQGCRLLTKAHISDFVSRLKNEKSEELGVTAEWVLRQAKELHLRCMQEIEPVMVRDGTQMVQATDDEGNRIFKFNAGGAAKALELVGKHVNVQAFNEKQSVDLAGGVVVYSGVPRAPDEDEADE